MTQCLLCYHDVAVTTKLLMKKAERSTKWCHSNDEKSGDNAVQRLKMLSSTTEQKGFCSTNMLCDGKTISIAERMHRPPLGGDTVLRRLLGALKKSGDISLSCDGPKSSNIEFDASLASSSCSLQICLAWTFCSFAAAFSWRSAAFSWPAIAGANKSSANFINKPATLSWHRVKALFSWPSRIVLKSSNSCSSSSRLASAASRPVSTVFNRVRSFDVQILARASFSESTPFAYRNNNPLQM